MTKRLTIKQKLHRQKLRKQVKLLKLGRRVRKTDGALYHAYQNYTIDSHNAFDPEFKWLYERSYPRI
jgi:hypothetical protein